MVTAEIPLPKGHFVKWLFAGVLSGRNLKTELGKSVELPVIPAFPVARKENL
jgi:hypothetical protein